MDFEKITPFVDSFNHVMLQMGFSDIKKGAMLAKGRDIQGDGVLIFVGIVGQIKGNVVYAISQEDAKRIASVMLLNKPVDKINAMAVSSLSELANMITANVATRLAKINIQVDISTPTFFRGEGVSVMMSSKKVLGIQMLADDAKIEMNISFD